MVLLKVFRWVYNIYILDTSVGWSASYQNPPDSISVAATDQIPQIMSGYKHELNYAISQMTHVTHKSCLSPSHTPVSSNTSTYHQGMSPENLSVSVHRSTSACTPWSTLMVYRTDASSPLLRRRAFWRLWI